MADYFVIALGMCGGAQRFVDVEDVFLKMHEIGPALFSWRTRPDLPEYKKCAKALQDVESKQHNAADNVRTRKPVGNESQAVLRQLSPAGERWLQSHSDEIAAALGRGGSVASINSGIGRTLRPIVDSSAYRRFVAGEQPTISLPVAADILLCSSDATLDLWQQRIEGYKTRAVAANDAEVSGFLEYLSEQVFGALSVQERSK